MTSSGGSYNQNSEQLVATAQRIRERLDNQDGIRTAMTGSHADYLRANFQSDTATVHQNKIQEAGAAMSRSIENGRALIDEMVSYARAITETSEQGTSNLNAIPTLG